VGKSGLLERVARYVREVLHEARRVVWLNRRQTMTYTAVVVVAVGILAGFMYAFDKLLNLVSQGFMGAV
jgi:preprotein translocase subunit SecE